MREYILAVKALLRGEPAIYRGQTFEQAWSSWEPRDVPIYVACSGPKVLSMASQVADGVVVTMGFAPGERRDDPGHHPSCLWRGRS